MKNGVWLLCFLILNLLVVRESSADSCGDVFVLTNVVNFVPAPAPAGKMLEVDPEEALADFALAKIEKTAKEFAAQISQLQDKINFWSKLTGRTKSSAVLAIRDRRRIFQFELEDTGDTYAAVTVYAKIFRTFETAYLQMQAYYAKAAPHKAPPPEIKKLLQVFGENYGDYVYVRGYLERLADGASSAPSSAAPAGTPTIADPVALELQRRAREVLRRLSAVEVTDRFPQLSPQYRSPSLDELRQFWHDHTEPLIYKLKKDLVSERVLAIKIFLTATPRFFQTAVTTFTPPFVRDALSKFFVLIYNWQVAKTYLPDIDTIVEAEGSGRFETFINLYAVHDHDGDKGQEFLTTFGRMASKNEVWQDLKERMEEQLSDPNSKDNVVYQRIYKQMQDIEAKILSGDLSLLSDLREPNLLDNYTLWIAPLGAGAITGGYLNWAHIQEAATYLAQNFHL